MANFNKVIMIGRLTRDPETRTFANGGMVAKFGFAVTNRRKNSQTGQWEDEPMYIDCDVFNRGETGRLADLVRDRCRKGTQIMIEGKLQLETWDDKNNPGQKRSKHKIMVDAIQLLDSRPGGMGAPSSGGYSEFGGDEGGMDNSTRSNFGNRGSMSHGAPPSKSFSQEHGSDLDDMQNDNQNGDIPF